MGIRDLFGYLTEPITQKRTIAQLEQSGQADVKRIIANAQARRDMAAITKADQQFINRQPKRTMVSGATLPTARPVATPGIPTNPYSDLITSTAKKYGIKPKFLDSVVYAESRYDPKARSKNGAIGLGQLTPLALKDIGYAGHPDTLYDPGTNLDLTAQYLSKIYDIAKPKAPLDWYAAYSFGPYNKTPISSAYANNFNTAYNRY